MAGGCHNSKHEEKQKGTKKRRERDRRDSELFVRSGLLLPLVVRFSVEHNPLPAALSLMWDSANESSLAAKTTPALVIV